MTKRLTSLSVLRFALWGAAALPCATLAHATDAPPPNTQPIVPDTIFDAALPPLDTTTATPAPVESLPAVTTGDDQELNKPLPPLEGYNVQPLQTAAMATEGPQPQVTYATVVDGLKEIGLLDRFKSLSALQTGKGKAVNSAMVRARATEDEALVLRLIKSEGYFDGTVTTTVIAVKDTSGQVVAHLTAVPGQAYAIGAIAIDAQPTKPDTLIRDNLPLRTGDRIVADQVLAAEANVSLVLPQQGYPFAKVTGRDIALDDVTHAGDYTLKADTGDRSVFAGFRLDGDAKPPFSAEHVGVLTRFDKGELYDSRKVDDLQQALIATSLFRSVAVEPVATGERDADGNAYVDLVVHEQKGPARTLAASAGYSTGEGLTAEGTWTNRNMFPPEGALTYRAALGTQESALAVTFRRSNDKHRDLTLQLGADIERNTYAAYGATTAGVSGSISRVSTPIWQKRWTWSYGFETVATRETSTDPVTGLHVDKTYYIADTPVQIGYDRSDDLLNPAKGFRLSGQVTPQLSAGSGSASNIRTVLDGSYYYPIGGRIVLATRARIGVLLGGNLADIAPSRRLYAGGGGSVRGYAYQGLGPLDVNGDPTGGRSLIETSFELRYRFGNYGIVPFIDMGQVYDKTFPTFSDLRVGIGVGARLYTNFGPVRIDIASPVDRRATEPQFALYVGIGQAF